MAVPGQSTLFNTFTELVTTSYRNHKKEVADAVSNHNALFRRLTKKGKVRREDGGLSIVVPIEYAENSTYQRYSGYDTLNISASDVLTAAEYPWRQVAVNVAASGLELRSNNGENRIVNFIKTKIKNGSKTMANGLAEDLYSDGTLSNQMNGVQALIADAGTGTVGGINSSTFSFWANSVQSAASPLQGGGSITPAKGTIQSLMLPLYLALTRGTDAPDLIVMDDTYFTFYEESLTDLKRYSGTADDATGGFVSLKYKNADVIFDSAASGIPNAHGYFINTDYMELVVHEDAFMDVMPELKSVNQDAVNVPILFQGNLCTSNRKFQGVMKA